MDETDLDDLLATSRGGAMAEAPPALLARVMADALNLQPQAAPRLKPRLWLAEAWSALVASLGGGVAVSGIGGAAIAGVMIGLLQPAALSEVFWADSPLETVDLIPSFDTFLAEG